MDSLGKTSNELHELFIKKSQPVKPFLHIIGYPRRTNSKDIVVKVAAPVGSTISYKGITTTPTTTLLVDIPIHIDTDSTSAVNAITFTATNSGVASDTRNITVEYNESFSNSYLQELNKGVQYVPYFPEDLLVGFFKLANHFYNGTLYNNNNIDTYRTDVNVSQTYTSHTIPKDVKALLSTYTYYLP